MRRFVLATAAFMTLAPLVHAQSPTGTTGQGWSGSTAAPGAASPGNSMNAPGGSTSAAIGQPDPTNCGTPDEQKPCGPMPRKALNHFPSKRASGSS
jgi:hypothetical protein